MDSCIFCKIVNHEVPADVLIENADVAVFMSLENHALVVPKKHIKDIYSLDAETGSKIMEELIRTSNATKKALGCDGVYITQANEPAAGQEVFHLHFHVYPCWQGKPMKQEGKVGDAERAATFEKLKSFYA